MCYHSNSTAPTNASYSNTRLIPGTPDHIRATSEERTMEHSELKHAFPRPKLRLQAFRPIRTSVSMSSPTPNVYENTSAT